MLFHPVRVVTLMTFRLLLSSVSFAFACGAFLPASAQSAEARKASDHSSSGKNPYVLERTEERFITAKSGKEYRILISWPQGEAPAEGHAITYVLDGDELFPMMTGILRVQAGTEKLSNHNAITPGIIVAVGYREASGRNVDYTPAAPPGPPETYVDGRPYPKQESGGAEAFYTFLEEELKPAIAKDYPVNAKRQSLLGNGYGGLFCLHVLYNHPESFQTYIASSPSVWWNNRYILQEEAAFAARAKEKPLNATLLITVGDLEQSLTEHEYSWPDKPREEHALKTSRRRMVDNTREMYWRLKKLETAGLKTAYHIFPGESHKSVIPMAVCRALPYVFPPVAPKKEARSADASR